MLVTTWMLPERLQPEDDERVSKLHLQNQQLPLPQRRDSMPFLYVLVAPGSSIYIYILSVSAQA